MLLNISVFAEMSSKDFEKSIFFSEFSRSRLFFLRLQRREKFDQGFTKNFHSPQIRVIDPVGHYAHIRDPEFRKFRIFCRAVSQCDPVFFRKFPEKLHKEPGIIGAVVCIVPIRTHPGGQDRMGSQDQPFFSGGTEAFQNLVVGVFDRFLRQTRIIDKFADDQISIGIFDIFPEVVRRISTFIQKSFGASAAPAVTLQTDIGGRIFFPAGW